MTEQNKSEAQELLDSRRAVYGDRVDNMKRVAALWSALLGVEILDWQVPLLMSAYKMFRTFETPNYSDNSDDIDGWKQMFVEVMDANHGGIIKARTVEEYAAEVQRRLRDPEKEQARGSQAQDEGESIEAFNARLRRQLASDDGVQYDA